MNTYQHRFNKANGKLHAYKTNLSFLKTEDSEITKHVFDLVETMNELKKELYGSRAKHKIGEKTEPTITSWLWKARGTSNSYGPTQLHMESYEIANTLFGNIKPRLDSYLEEITALGKQLENAGAPVILD